MNTPAIRTSRVPIHLVAVAAALAGTVGAIAGAATAGADDRPVQVIGEDVVPPSPQLDSTPIYLEVLERARLRDAVDGMPAGWPATEVMRQQIEAPLGDAAQRATWLEVAERMPAGWPATEATRESGAEGSG